MSYVIIEGGLIQAEIIVSGLPTASLIEERGWVEIVDTVRPVDTVAVTYDRTLELIEGVPTVVWVQRPKNSIEIAADVAQAKVVKLQASIATLRNWAVTARGATVTSTNAVAALGTVVRNLGEFYDGFADLLETVIPSDDA